MNEEYGSVEVEAVQRILLDHLRRYPRMDLQDLYKLAHQAAFGSEHAVPDPALARRLLETEWATMGQGPEEPVFDPIAPDGSVLRIHLRPFATGGGNRDQLLMAFVRTAREFRGHPQRIALFKSCAVAMAERGLLPWTADPVRAFWAANEKDGWPVRHHSPEYVKAYRPAYRIVAASCWAQR